MRETFNFSAQENITGLEALHKRRQAEIAQHKSAGERRLKQALNDAVITLLEKHAERSLN